MFSSHVEINVSILVINKYLTYGNSRSLSSSFFFGHSANFGIGEWIDWWAILLSITTAISDLSISIIPLKCSSSFRTSSMDLNNLWTTKGPIEPLSSFGFIVLNLRNRGSWFNAAWTPLFCTSCWTSGSARTSFLFLLACKLLIRVCCSRICLHNYATTFVKLGHAITSFSSCTQPIPRIQSSYPCPCIILS